MRHFSSYRWAGATVTALGLLATTAAGQPPRPAPASPIDAAKAQQSVTEQKTLIDLSQTIDNADRLAKGNRKETAVQTLKNAKQNIQFAQGISDDARTRFTAMIDAKLAAIEGRVLALPNPNPGVKLDPKAAEVKATNDQVIARYFAELKDVRDGIKLVEKAQADKDTTRANTEIARLTKAYPNNPSVISLAQQGSMQDRIAGAQAHYVESSQRWVANQMSINTSSLPAIGDIEFPKNWKELSTRRLKANTIQMSDKEKKIIEALDRPVMFVSPANRTSDIFQ